MRSQLMLVNRGGKMLSDKMKSTFIILLLASIANCDILKTVKNAGQDTISAVATPVGKTVVATTLKKCEPFKLLFGVTFDQLSEKNEPDVTKLNIDFLTADNKTVFPIMEAARGLLKTPEYDVKKPTVIFLHGFLSSPTSDAAKSVTTPFLEMGGLNVLALDSSSMIGFFYLKSSSCVQFIGEALGEVFAELYKGGVDPDKVHIIGHSLGSHIAGFAGKTFKNITGKSIDRITGLDPAGPCFFQERPDLRLKETDARFVDVIHSDAGVLGLSEPLGHIDFYPNDGEAQPGCAIPPCSHSRSWQLFSESIQNLEAFPAVKCRGWDSFKSGGCEHNELNYMGYGVNRKSRGDFYLKTEGESPYGLGKHVQKSENEDEKKSKLFGIF